MAEVSREFGRPLTAEVLTDHPTIEQLAEVLRGTPHFGKGSSLIVLRASGKHPPLVCLPGIFGTVWEFRRLAECLGQDFPVYALQPQGIDGVAAPHETIVEMARHNVDELRAVQPTGPYYLVGHSLGGTVAYEMAQILHAAGESVPLLVLMDSPMRGRSRAYRAIQRLINRIWGNYYSGSVAAPTTAHPPQLAMGVMAVAAGISDDFGVEGSAPTAAGLRLLRTHRRALDRYRPRRYPGRVTIFRPQMVSTWFKRFFDDHSLGWINLCDQGGEVHVVPGDHTGMFSIACVETLAETLQGCLLAAIPSADAGASRPAGGSSDR